MIRKFLLAFCFFAAAVTAHAEVMNITPGWAGVFTGTPSLSSCGTSPSLATGSTNRAGSIVYGTGSPTGCLLTFSTPYVGNFTCVITWRLSKTVMAYNLTVNDITLYQEPGTNGSIVDYLCTQL